MKCRYCKKFDKKYQQCTSGQQIADHCGEYGVSPEFNCNIWDEFEQADYDPLKSAIDRIKSWELVNPAMGEDATIDLEDIPIAEARIMLAALQQMKG